jgi:uncharacterized LabA/DUF88 family protein
MKKRALVLFDGSNFYNKVKSIDRNVHLTFYNYYKFAKFISEKIPFDSCYYIGEVKQYRNNKKSQTLYASQQTLFTHLRKQNIQIKTGYLLQTNGKFHEKGVDVQIAVDIVSGTLLNQYSHFYLISSDTDLLPAIHIAKQKKKNVVYVGFESFMSKALITNCTSYKILKKTDIKRFVK